MITTAEAGSTTEVAEGLFISQLSLPGATREVEKEAGVSIFTRCRAGIALTKEGMEFLGYARQIIQQMELFESEYISDQPTKQRFCISTRHYTFTANVFVELAQRFGQERLEFILNETQTHQITMDIENGLSDIGILYFSSGNKNALQKSLEENGLVFYELFAASPHVFLYRDRPLTNQNSLKLKDLQPYPKFSFMQGDHESDYFAEELFDNEPMEKNIRVSDRAAIINSIIGLDGYTISSRIFPKYLQGDDITPIPFDEDEMVCIGYIFNKDVELTELGEICIGVLKKYGPQ